MSMTIPYEIVEKTSCSALDVYRRHSGSWRDPGGLVFIDTERLEDSDLRQIEQAAIELGEKSVARAISAMIGAREGDLTKAVPSFRAFATMLWAYLRSDIIDGWVYLENWDGTLLPALVTNIDYSGPERSNSRRNDENPHITMQLVYYGLNNSYAGSQYGNSTIGVQKCSIHFEASDVVRKKLPDILATKRLLKETPDLKARYAASLVRHDKTTRDGFGEQFRVTGDLLRAASRDSELGSGRDRTNRRVIHDVEPAKAVRAVSHAESKLFRIDDAGVVPEHPVVKVFDLSDHAYYWVHADNLVPYEYDESLREKLILPVSSRDLLDVLINDPDSYINDIVEGKRAGNILLAKGRPGLGKTLSAEVYAETMKRPLLSIHAGELGTVPAEIEKKLKEIFALAERWQCHLLLDEADVFVARRGSDMVRNAVVSVFLRVLEYFGGLLWLTTNRPDDIDDAVISRCAAIIQYETPSKEHAERIWRVMSTQFGAKLDDSLIDRLIKAYPTITGRDIKLLLGVALRVAKSKSIPVDFDTIRKCAMFRAIPPALVTDED